MRRLLLTLAKVEIEITVWGGTLRFYHISRGTSEIKVVQIIASNSGVGSVFLVCSELFKATAEIKAVLVILWWVWAFLLRRSLRRLFGLLLSVLHPRFFLLLGSLLGQFDGPSEFFIFVHLLLFSPVLSFPCALIAPFRSIM